MGRSAIIIAIDIEHIELLEILLNLGLEIRDALLHAIEEENIYAVELLLQYQDSMKGKKKTKDLSVSAILLAMLVVEKKFWSYCTILAAT